MLSPGVGAAPSSPRVLALGSLDEVAPLAPQIDALNLASRRPCPFATFGYLEAFLAHDEHAQEGDERLFLAAFDGSRLVGFLPLRRRRVRVLGLRTWRIGMLVDHDTDRPRVVARAEDEARCCAAFYAHLVRADRRWSLLELGFQDSESGLEELPPHSPLRYYVRRFENMPNTTVSLPYGSLAEYFNSLANPQRKLVGRFGRRLFAAGKVEVVTSADAVARPEMLELYLDLERRSWKVAAHAGIGRDPRRLAFYRSLCSPAQPLGLRFLFIVLDGLPISGFVLGAYANRLFALETSFDQDYDDLAPGHLLFLMAMAHAIDNGLSSVNFDGNYAYYKSRWGGLVTPTQAIQIFRVASLLHFKARLGEFARFLGRHRALASVAGRFNPERRKTLVARSEEAHEEERTRTRPARLEERERARRSFREVELLGAKLTRLTGADLEILLPFKIGLTAPGNQPRRESA